MPTPDAKGVWPAAGAVSALPRGAGQYSAFPVEGDHSQKARVMHQKFDAFPSYQGDHVPERTKSYKFRPTSGGDHGTDPFYGLQGNKQYAPCPCAQPSLEMSGLVR